MHSGLCVLLGLLAYLNLCQLTFSQEQTVQAAREQPPGGPGLGDWEYRGRRSERIRRLEQRVEGLRKQGRGISGRIDYFERTVNYLAERECQTGEGSVGTPIGNIVFVPFGTSFRVPPKVSVSLRGMSLFIIKTCELRVESVTSDGFNLWVVGAGLGVDIYYTWTACPSAAEFYG